MTTLVACSHGTRSPAGRTVIARIRTALAAAVPEAALREAYVDVEQPEVAGVVAEAAAHGPVVVLPLLLSTGFHTSVDIAAAVAPHPSAAAAEPLGPHELLVRSLRDRLAAVSGGDAGHRPGDHVVLAAAGSSDPAAACAVERMRDLLAARLPAPVTVGYGAGCAPTIPEAVARARAAGARRVIAASYVLAPGHFADLVERAGADLVSAPLGDHPAVIAVAAARFRQACLALTAPAAG
ncbi:sirohydrochlorin chelatase [Brachybacterium paraconglomeratum]|uniref:sirohydrochlorin chelatase n=1 Tax=Brachybacterium paraconglomeratum TaxID=173362 RepID=UPI00223C2907|nr:CbiX/SirB N-terminal domain-containing protein [Brachybacterium paraconglomeratum]MCT1436528.1 sirohydrochlorin chelatase [Brachybacterium paraconglomeratum]